MASVIKSRTFTAIQDNRIVLQSSNFARPFNIPVWTTIRIAMRLNMRTTAADILAVDNPFFYIGLCAGGGANCLALDAGTIHWVGAKTSGLWRSFVGTPDEYYGFDLKATKRLNGVETDNPTILIGTNSCAILNNVSIAGRGMFFIDITKGNPDYSVRLALIYDSAIPALTDVSVADFQATKVMPVPAFTSHVVGNTQTIAVNEADGAFDHVNLAWNQLTPAIEICDLAVYKTA